MNRLKLLLLGILFCGNLSAQEWSPQEWPSIKHYDSDHLYRIALPLGGIGTGTVSLGGRGELRDWEIMNVPAKNYSTVTTELSATHSANPNVATTTLVRWQVGLRFRLGVDSTTLA